MPETPGRTTIRTRTHARVTICRLMAWLSDYARMGVPTRGDAHTEDDFYIKVGQNVGLVAQEIKFAGVCYMRVRGRSWAEIAAALKFPDVDDAIGIYEGPYERWKRGDPNPWRTRVSGVAAMPTDAYGDPDQLAALLDEWCAANGASDGPLVPGLRAVTDHLY